MRKPKGGKPTVRRTDKPDDQPAAKASRDESLGYAQDAGHPGGLQDLGAKSDTEAEHDSWERHG
jgi:hypothetical protein